MPRRRTTTSASTTSRGSPASHSTYQTIDAMFDGICRGFFVLGENPAVGSANSAMQRLAMAELDWLVVRDFR